MKTLSSCLLTASHKIFLTIRRIKIAAIKAKILTITKMESPSLATKFPMVRRASETVCVEESVSM